MIFAPVIIPTLNRFNHLKQCVDSLNRCHNADKTEVFISVDFPPSEKYIEGHDMICEYLENSVFNFKKLHVYRQAINLGVKSTSEKESNGSFLIAVVRKQFDRWIFTEDDNIFAPGFLDFMNNCLDRFRDDPSVFSICGYRFYYDLKFEGNNFFRQHSDFNAWGCGFWRDKLMDIQRVDVSYLRKMVYNPIKVIKLWRVSSLQVLHLAGFSQKVGFKKGDNVYSLFMIDRGLTQIMPAISLVRNIGWDDSGLHCVGFDEETVEKHMNQDLDTSSSFTQLIGTGWECFKENERVIRDEDFQRCSFWDALFCYLKRIIAFWK